MPLPSLLHKDRHIAFIVLFGLFLVYEWPRLLHPGSSLLGFPQADFCPNLWNFWFLRDALLEMRSPFETTILFQGRPTGLFFHLLNLTYFILTLPATLLFDNPFLSYNLSVLLADALGLSLFYRLIRALGGGRAAAIVATSCFTFSAYKFQHSGQLNLQSLWLISTYSLFLLKLWTKARYRHAAALGVTVVLLLGSSWHYLLFLALATPFLLGWYIQRQNLPMFDHKRLRRLYLTIAIVTPFLLLYSWLGASQADLFEHNNYNMIIRLHWSASPFHYLVPAWLKGPFIEAADIVELEDIPNPMAFDFFGEYAIYLGLIPITLLLLTLRHTSWRQDKALWMNILFFFILSLGPFLRIIDVVKINEETFLKLPAYLIYNLPIISSTKHVSRFALMVLFFILLLTCTNKRLPWLSAKRLRRPTLIATVLLLLLHRIDIAQYIPPATPYRPPVAMQAALANVQSDGIAMVFPGVLWSHEAVGMYLQTLHKHTLLHGYLSRKPRGARAATFDYGFMHYLAGLQLRQLAPPQYIAKAIKDRPTLCILLNTILSPSDSERLVRMLQGSLAFNVIYKDENITILERDDTRIPHAVPLRPIH